MKRFLIVTIFLLVLHGAFAQTNSFGQMYDPLAVVKTIKNGKKMSGFYVKVNVGLRTAQFFVDKKMEVLVGEYNLGEQYWVAWNPSYLNPTLVEMKAFYKKINLSKTILCRTRDGTLIGVLSMGEISRVSGMKTDDGSSGSLHIRNDITATARYVAPNVASTYGSDDEDVMITGTARETLSANTILSFTGNVVPPSQGAGANGTGGASGAPQGGTAPSGSNPSLSGGAVAGGSSGSSSSGSGSTSNTNVINNTTVINNTNITNNTTVTNNTNVTNNTTVTNNNGNSASSGSGTNTSSGSSSGTGASSSSGSGSSSGNSASSGSGTNTSSGSSSGTGANSSSGSGISSGNSASSGSGTNTSSGSSSGSSASYSSADGSLYFLGKKGDKYYCSEIRYEGDVSVYVFNIPASDINSCKTCFGGEFKTVSINGQNQTNGVSIYKFNSTAGSTISLDTTDASGARCHNLIIVNKITGN